MQSETRPEKKATLYALSTIYSRAPGTDDAGSEPLAAVAESLAKLHKAFRADAAESGQQEAQKQRYLARLFNSSATPVIRQAGTRVHSPDRLRVASYVAFATPDTRSVPRARELRNAGVLASQSPDDVARQRALASQTVQRAAGLGTPSHALLLETLQRASHGRDSLAVPQAEAGHATQQPDTVLLRAATPAELLETQRAALPPGAVATAFGASAAAASLQDPELLAPGPGPSLLTAGLFAPPASPRWERLAPSALATAAPLALSSAALAASPVVPLALSRPSSTGRRYAPPRSLAADVGPPGAASTGTAALDRLLMGGLGVAPRTAGGQRMAWPPVLDSTGGAGAEEASAVAHAVGFWATCAMGRVYETCPGPNSKACCHGGGVARTGPPVGARGRYLPPAAASGAAPPSQRPLSPLQPTREFPWRAAESLTQQLSAGEATGAGARPGSPGRGAGPERRVGLPVLPRSAHPVPVQPEVALGPVATQGQGAARPEVVGALQGAQVRGGGSAAHAQPSLLLVSGSPTRSAMQRVQACVCAP
jgi:hypothetical protein